MQDGGTPVTHIKSKIKVCIMTESVKIPKDEIPGELYPIFRMQQGQGGEESTSYLPIVYVDELSQRLSDLVIVNSTDKTAQKLDFSGKKVKKKKIREKIAKLRTFARN